MMPAICARTVGRRVPPARFPRLRPLRPRSRHPRRQSPQRPALPPRSLSVRLPPSILQHHRWAVLRGLGVPRPSRRLRQCHSPHRNPWRMLQLPLRFLRLRLPIQLWVSSFVSRTPPCLDATRFLLWLRTLPCPGSMPAFVLSGAHGWLPMRGPITERLLCVAARSSTWFLAWPSRFIPAIRYSFRLRLANLPNCV